MSIGVHLKRLSVDIPEKKHTKATFKKISSLNKHKQENKNKQHCEMSKHAGGRHIGKKCRQAGNREEAGPWQEPAVNLVAISRM